MAVGDEVGEVVERGRDVVVELDRGEVGLEAVVVLVFGPLGPVPRLLHAGERGVDRVGVGVVRDVPLVAGEALAEVRVVDHPEDRRERVREPDRLLRRRVVGAPDDERVGALGEGGEVRVVDLAEVGALEPIEAVDELVEPLDVEVAGLLRVEREEVAQHLGFEQLQELLDRDDVALGGGERLAVEREPLVHHRHGRLLAEDVPRHVDAGGPRPLRVVLPERLEVDAEDAPLGGPLQPPRELPLAERRGALVAAPLDGVAAGVHVGTDVVDGLRVEVDRGHRLRHLPALLADGVERDVLVVDLVLVRREHLADALDV